MNILFVVFTSSFMMSYSGSSFSSMWYKCGEVYFKPYGVKVVLFNILLSKITQINKISKS